MSDCSKHDLAARIQELEERLAEKEETLEAIRTGQVDALVVDTPEGEKVYALTGANHGYRVLVETIAEGAVILSPDDSVFYCNKAISDMLGMPAGNIITRVLADFIIPEERSKLTGMVARIRAGGEARGEFYLRRSSGSFLPVMVSFSRIPMPNFDGVCAVVTDLSEQKKVEEELKRHRAELQCRVEERTADLAHVNEELQRSHSELEFRVARRTADLSDALQKLEKSNQELQDFAYIVSHDLQEPLRKIQAFCSMLMRNSKGSMDIEDREHMGRVSNAAARMSELLKALLHYSRTGTSRIEYQTIDLTDVVRDAVSDLEVHIRGTNARVEIGDLPAVEGDAQLLRQLFQNLIVNALKYRKDSEPPVVNIYSVRGEGAWRIMVDDNGIGFEEAYCQKIFKPFQRLHGSNSPYKGIGMGLAICRKIVDRHGGQITARSTPGKGSQFIVILPVEQEAANNKT